MRKRTGDTAVSHGIPLFIPPPAFLLVLSPSFSPLIAHHTPSYPPSLLLLRSLPTSMGFFPLPPPPWSLPLKSPLLRDSVDRSVCLNPLACSRTPKRRDIESRGLAASAFSWGRILRLTRRRAEDLRGPRKQEQQGTGVGTRRARAWRTRRLSGVVREAGAMDRRSWRRCAEREM